MPFALWEPVRRAVHRMRPWSPQAASAVCSSDRTLSALMREAVAIATDRRLAHLTLSQDPASHRLTPRTADEAVTFAINSGQSAAKITAEQWGRDPEQIAADLNVPIHRNEDTAQTAKVALFSEYRGKPPSIVLHTHSIQQVNALIREHGLADLLGVADVGPVHLARELYHHLEAEKLVPGTSAIRIQTLTLGPIRLGSGLPSLSEIAADHFAKTLLSLKLPPRALTFLTVYTLNAEYAWELLGRAKQLPN